MIMSFLKFAILSTFGECIGLRISAGVYNREGFGIWPRAIVWGILGMGISMAMTIFSSGVPVFLKTMGMENAVAVMGECVVGQGVRGLLYFCGTEHDFCSCFYDIA